MFKLFGDTPRSVSTIVEEMTAKAQELKESVSFYKEEAKAKQKRADELKLEADKLLLEGKKADIIGDRVLAQYSVSQEDLDALDQPTED